MMSNRERAVLVNNGPEDTEWEARNEVAADNVDELTLEELETLNTHGLY